MACVAGRAFSASLFLFAGVAAARAQDIESVTVTGRASDLTGLAASANQGVIGALDLSQRAFLRPGEVVEEIPGVIITQHSGSGKANQYFLRGFNLDHGTDLSVNLDGVPVNMPSHGHGQGYADLNFLIPELVRQLEYKKGPYYADVGNFGAAGQFNLRYYDTLPDDFVKTEAGQFGYARLLGAANLAAGGGNLLLAGEFEHNDGPWVRGDDERKLNGVLRYSGGDDSQGWSVTAMAYHNRWNSTDQIPSRAVIGGSDPYAPPAADPVSRWGSIDASDGGSTGRYSASADWHAADRLHASVYGIYYDLALFSNFTYFLNDHLHGDQIGQKDRRYIFGGQLDGSWDASLLGHDTAIAAGLAARHDDIRVGLFQSQNRAILGVTTLDDISETSLSPYIQGETRWTSWLRTILGLRSDVFFFEVGNLAGGNSGHVTAAVLSPKVNVILGPWSDTEFYLDFGQGFHSNDARGVAAGAAPLPRSTGGEIGMRSTVIPGLRSELSLWLLDMQSELVWAGDAGGNEPAGPTQRYGVEFANWYTPNSWLTLDADYAWSRAYFTDAEPGGNRVPEALAMTFDGGVALHNLPGALAGWSAGLRLRYFGPRPLTQDGTVHSKPTTLVYADLAYAFQNGWEMGLNIFNLLDDRSSDIDYFYTSRLPGEPSAGVDDIHTHPSEPREFRLSLTRHF